MAVRGILVAAACLWGSTLWASAAFAEIAESWRVAGWDVAAHWDENRGGFSHCAMSSQRQGGTLMLFSITSDFRWFLGFANDQWRLAPDAVYDVGLSIDNGPAIPVKATAVSETLVAIILPDSSELFERFRAGHRLTMVTAGDVFRFSLRGTARALGATLDCVGRYTRPARGKADPFAPSPPAAETRARPSDRVAEATIFVANVLSRAGLSGYYIVPPAERPEAFRDFDVVWTAGDVIGTAHVVLPETAPAFDDIRAQLIAADSRSCAGKFASGGSSRDGEVFTACEEGEDTWSVHYYTVQRPAGGHIVLGVVEVGDNKTDAENAARSIGNEMRER